MMRWPLAALALLMAATVPRDAPRAQEMPEVAAMQGPGLGCAAPFLLRAGAPTARRVVAEEPPPWRRAMLTCLAEAGNPKRPLRRT